MLYIYENHVGGGIYATDRELSDSEIYCEQCGDSDIFLGEYDRSDAAAIWEAIYPPEDEDHYRPSVHILDAMGFMYNHVPNPSPTYITPLYISDKGNMLAYSSGFLIRYYCYDPDRYAEELVVKSILPRGRNPKFLSSWITSDGTTILLYSVKARNPVMMLNNERVYYVDPREFVPRKEDAELWENIMEALNGTE